MCTLREDVSIHVLFELSADDVPKSEASLRTLLFATIVEFDGKFADTNERKLILQFDSEEQADAFIQRAEKILLKCNKRPEFQSGLHGRFFRIVAKKAEGNF